MPAFPRPQPDAIEDVLTQFAASMRSASEARARDLTVELNQAVRRLRNASDTGEWLRALMDASRSFCARTCFFSLSGDALRIESISGWYDAAAFEQLGAASILLAAAPGFSTAIETRDVTVAMAAPGEISPQLAGFLEGPAGRKVYLFPLVTGEALAVQSGPGADEEDPAGSVSGRVAGILFADPGEGGIDTAGLEMLALVAATTLDLRLRSAAPQKDLLNIAPAAPPAAPVSPPDAVAPPSAALDPLDLYARRYARTFAAELLLNRFADVKKAREQKDIYDILKEEIQSGRYVFRERFLSAHPSLPDHLHRELVRTLAADDESCLGPNYPGPLR